MTDQTLYTLFVVGIIVLATQLTRWIPFLLFSEKRGVPKFVHYLGKILPPAIIATLIVFCLKSVDFKSAASLLPQLISIAVVAALHLWRRNSLLSIGSGTVCFMLLSRLVFAGLYLSLYFMNILLKLSAFLNLLSENYCIILPFAI